MAEQCVKIDQNPCDSTSSRLQRVALCLSAGAIVTSAFHFCPFEHSKVWQMLNISNLSIILWVFAILVLSLLRCNLKPIRMFLPHTSIIAYLVINILSIAMAADFTRSINFTAKVVLVFFGGYLMFSTAVRNSRTIKFLYNVMIMAVTISVLYCLLRRFTLHTDTFGFHESVFKYGTYIGMLVPACGTYLFLQRTIWSLLSATALVICALVSAGSIGAVAAITAGLLTACTVIKEGLVKRWILISLILGLVSIFVANQSLSTGIWKDLKLTDNDGTNLRQRYIEWQAEINSLQERTIAGMAPGCINDYRSTFYYRLPKLNTLKPFDQNGWLATAAETGIVGLVCFCWIIVYHGKIAYVSILKCRSTNSHLQACAGANIAGLAAACVANLFSSVLYNGILIAFVLLLALICGTNRIMEES